LQVTSQERLQALALAAIGALFFASGAAGLIYEVLWFRLLLLNLGGTGLSVATVTAAFMTGLGLGAWLFGTRIATRARPLTVYGVLEICIGAYALVVPWAIAQAGRLDAALLGAEPGAFGRLVGFFLAGAVLLPPTLCMGATLPVLSRLIARTDGTPGAFVGFLYGANTIGAMLGAWSTGFVLMPRIGLQRSIVAAAVVNLVLGGIALVLSRTRAASEPCAASAERDHEPDVARADWLSALTASFGSGLVGFVLQVAWTRILALVFGSSIYAFSLILVVFLAGLGAGALAGARLSKRVASARRALAACLAGAGAAALLEQGLYNVLPKLYLDAIVATGERQALGSAMWMAAAIMLPATLLLGAAFPFVVRLATGDRSASAARSVGWIYAANTAGGVLGAYTTALWLVPAFGLAGAVTGGATALLLLGAILSLVSARRETAGSAKGPLASPYALPGVAAAVFAVWLVAVPGWDRALMSMGVGIWGARARADGRDVERELQSLARDRILFYRDGVTSTVAVKESGGGAGATRHMTVDGKIDASNGGDMPTQVLGGQIPVLAAGRRGTDILVIGYASGVSVGSVLTHPVASVTVVEIEHVVEAASHYFDDVNHTPLADPRTRLVFNDARAYLERTDRRFDAIFSEPSSAWLSGPSKLFTRETFQAIRSKLKPGGVAGQWLQTYDLGPEDVLTVIRTLREVFPQVAVLRLLGGADLLLLASERPIRFVMADLDAAWSEGAVRTDLERVGIRGPCDILDRVVAEPAQVDAVLGRGPLNTDDNALLEYHGAQRVGAKGDVATLARLSQGARGAAAILAPDDPRSTAALAARCLREGAWDAARSLATSSLANARSAAALWVLGESARGAGRREEALDLFAQALREDPRHAESRVSTAFALMELDRLAEARDAWTRAEATAPEDAAVPAFRGVARLQLGDARGAIADFRRARALTAGPAAPIRFDLYEGAALAEAGDARGAAVLLERAAAAFPEGEPPGTEGIAAFERLGRALAKDAATSRRGEVFLHRAERERAKLPQAILDEVVRIAAEAGEGPARGYLRSLTTLDPALAETLERQLATSPSPQAEGLRGLLRSVRS